MNKLYCISGLGADQKVFKHLQIPGTKLMPVEWVGYDKYDDMACYAQKLIEQIPDKEPYILGYSFGGMLATEIAKQIPVKKVFIVSSVIYIEELPKISALAKFLAREKLLPVGLFLSFHKLMYGKFGAKTEDEKRLIDEVMENTKSDFAKWCIGAIANWNNHHRPDNLIHIHGTKDRVIKPSPELKPDYWIEEGTHLMIYNMTQYIAPIIESYLPKNV